MFDVVPVSLRKISSDQQIQGEKVSGGYHDNNSWDIAGLDNFDNVPDHPSQAIRGTDIQPLCWAVAVAEDSTLRKPGASRTQPQPPRLKGAD